jgi:hypothetical protein
LGAWTIIQIQIPIAIWTMVAELTEILITLGIMREMDSNPFSLS